MAEERGRLLLGISTTWRNCDKVTGGAAILSLNIEHVVLNIWFFARDGYSDHNGKIGKID